MPAAGKGLSGLASIISGSGVMPVKAHAAWVWSSG